MKITFTFTIERAAPPVPAAAANPQPNTAQPPAVEPKLPDPRPDFRHGRYL